MMINGAPTVKDVARVVADMYDRFFAVRIPQYSTCILSDISSIHHRFRKQVQSTRLRVGLKQLGP